VTAPEFEDTLANDEALMADQTKLSLLCVKVKVVDNLQRLPFEERLVIIESQMAQFVVVDLFSHVSEPHSVALCQLKSGNLFSHLTYLLGHTALHSHELCDLELSAPVFSS
jgi:hypothetical protein